MELFYIIYLVLVLLTYLVIHKKLSIFREPVGKIAFWLATIVGLLTPILSRYLTTAYLFLVFVVLALVMALALSFVANRNKAAYDSDDNDDGNNYFGQDSDQTEDDSNNGYQLAQDIEDNKAEPSYQPEDRPFIEPLEEKVIEKKIETKDRLEELVGKTEDKVLDMAEETGGLQVTSLKAIEPIAKEVTKDQDSSSTSDSRPTFSDKFQGFKEVEARDAKAEPVIPIVPVKEEPMKARLSEDRQPIISPESSRHNQDFINLVKLQEELYKNKAQRKYQKAIDIANEIHRSAIPNHVRLLMHMELADLYLEIPDYKKAIENLDKIIADDAATIAVKQDASDKIDLINITSNRLASYKKPELAWSQVPRMIQLEVVEEISKKSR